MKHLFLVVMILASTTAFAETYYCVPKDGALLCRPQDFENRQFDGQNFRCYGKGETYRCVPFDNGAVLLETPRTCPTYPSDFFHTTN